jgi:hypothetical protein
MSIMDCIDHGVTARLPVAGVLYVGFVVHAAEPGRPVVLAIAHREGGKIVQDLISAGLTVAETAKLAKAYGITGLEGAVSEGDGLDLAHATLGVIDRARRLL